MATSLQACVNLHVCPNCLNTFSNFGGSGVTAGPSAPLCHGLRSEVELSKSEYTPNNPFVLSWKISYGYFAKKIISFWAHLWQ